MDLKLELSQKLTLSHNMMLSAEILQMNSMELLDYIKELSVENPVVEYEEKEAEKEKFDALKSKLEWLDGSDEQNRIYYNEDEKDNDEWNFSRSAGETLEESLLGQLNVLSLERQIHILAKYIIQNMDNNGYVKEDCESLYQIFRPFSIEKKAIEQSFSLVQSFEPAGVGASSLQECLLLQMDRLEEKNPLAEKIILEHLENVAKNKLPLIARSLKADMEDVTNAVQFIKSLNPRPGNSFATEKNCSYVVPDIIVEKEEDAFRILINDSYFPSIRISRQYKTMLSADISTAAKEYVSSRIRQAEWALTCISKRRSTLQATVEVIVSLQHDFFLHGVGNLQPMRLMDVAQKIHIHESTVSRAVRDKYLQCAHGVFPLSYFFSTGVHSKQAMQAGDRTTPDRVKSKMKQIIEEENKKAPLSDREIAQRLNGEGIAISRRTVAKYRESIQIPGMSFRKKYN